MIAFTLLNCYSIFSPVVVSVVDGSGAVLVVMSMTSFYKSEKKVGDAIISVIFPYLIIELKYYGSLPHSSFREGNERFNSLSVCSTRVNPIQCFSLPNFSQKVPPLRCSLCQTVFANLLPIRISTQLLKLQRHEQLDFAPSKRFLNRCSATVNFDSGK